MLAEIPQLQPCSARHWAADYDEVFFRMVSRLFPAVFVYGAGVLLASYDPEP